MKEYKFKINGKDYAVTIGEAEGKMLSVNVNGADYQVELEQEIAGQAGNDAKPAVIPGSDRGSQPATATPAPAPKGAGTTIKSPLPGIIISIDVKEGQAVKRGQKLDKSDQQFYRENRQIIDLKIEMTNEEQDILNEWMS